MLGSWWAVARREFHFSTLYMTFTGSSAFARREFHVLVSLWLFTFVAATSLHLLHSS